MLLTAAALAVALAAWGVSLLGGDRGGTAGPLVRQSPDASRPTARAAVADARPERLRVRVLRSYPHDPASYTQGLLWEPDGFLESSGHYGASFVRRWRATDGLALVERRLADHFFAEGLAAVDERVIQLTWREGVALYRDRATLEEVGRRQHEGEGWGLCYDGERLFMSDGSATLTVRDPESFLELDQVEVRAAGAPLALLNELECAEGWVYANVYQTDEIARIDPATGRVSAIIDASGLLRADERAGAEVLNGIAYNPERETFYLTGKRWPRLFEVRFEPAAADAPTSNPTTTRRGAS